MNLQTLFEYRSGRVIAVFRVVLALVFIGALVIEPNSYSRNLTISEYMLSGYLALGAVMIVVAWRSWWFDQRLALPMLAVDVVVFLVAVYLTESSRADFSSPFLAMFALIVLSATLRWDWRAAARTGVVATVLFVAVGAGMSLLDLPFDVFRFGRRMFYMLALLLVLVWFGIQRREPRVPPLAVPADAGAGDAALWAALDYAMELVGAGRGIVIWSPAEEPWIELRLRIGAERTMHRVGPDQVEAWDAARREVRLFDRDRRRKLIHDGDGQPRGLALISPLPFLDDLGIAEGLSLPIRAASGEGLVLLGGIAGLGPDFLTLGKVVAREIGAVLDREAVAELERSALVTRTRSAVARDLHDSVAQSLAGACFRLEALRRGIEGGTIGDAASVRADIASVRDALRREQGHVRSLIETLRQPAQEPQRDLAADLAATLADASAHWGVAAQLTAAGSASVPGWLSHEVQQLVREAVANAARHGAAREITVALAAYPGEIALDVVDDGSGFDADERSQRPWSISERVAALEGVLTVASGPGGTRLAITLPNRLPAGASA